MKRLIGILLLIAPLLVAQDLSPATSISTRGLVGYWKTDWVTGTLAIDSSGQGNHGTLSGGMSAASLTNSAHRGNAYHFDGVGNYVSIGSPASLSSLQVPMTITCWARISPTTAQGSILAQYQGVTGSQLVKLLGYATSEFSYYSSKADGTFQRFAYSTIPSTNVWHFLTVVVSGSLASPTLRLGSDGVEETFTPTALSVTPDTNVPIFLGADNAGGSPAEFRLGDIDEMTIWNRALTPSEINILYHQ